MCGAYDGRGYTHTWFKLGGCRERNIRLRCCGVILLREVMTMEYPVINVMEQYYDRGFTPGIPDEWQPRKFVSDKDVIGILYEVTSEATLPAMKDYLRRTNQDEKLAEYIAYPERGEVIVKFPTDEEASCGWWVAAWRGEIVWVLPGFLTRVEPITAKPGKVYYPERDNAFDVLATSISFDDVRCNTRELWRHNGSCNRFAPWMIWSEDFWECLNSACVWKRTKARGPRPVCEVACDAGRHKSRMVARALAVWTNGVYMAPSAETHGGCEGCQRQHTTNEEFALTMQHAMLRFSRQSVMI